MRATHITVLAVLSAFVGFTLAEATRRTIPGPDAGDWLTASSAAFGVVVTILGAVWIEEYRSQSRENQKLRRVQEALKELTNAARSAELGIPAWVNDNVANRTRSQSLQDRLVAAMAKYRFVRGQVEITDLQLWEALGNFDDVLAREGATVERERRILQENGQHQAVYEINRDGVSAAAGAIAEAIAIPQARLGALL